MSRLVFIYPRTKL